MWGNCHIFSPVCSLSQWATEQATFRLHSSTLRAYDSGVENYHVKRHQVSYCLFYLSNQYDQSSLLFHQRRTEDRLTRFVNTSISHTNGKADISRWDNSFGTSQLSSSCQGYGHSKSRFVSSSHHLCWWIQSYGSLDSVLCEPFHRTSSRDYTHRILILASEFISRTRTALILRARPENVGFPVTS